MLSTASTGGSTTSRKSTAPPRWTRSPDAGELMAYWADKVATALQGSLQGLRAYTAQRDADADTYRRALRVQASLSAAEIVELVNEVPNPGALPSEEHGRSGDWFVR